jgi:hypothetical protein
VHWHLAPLPPGVPFEQQQFAALDTSVCLDVSDDELAELARKLREAILVSAAEPHAVDDEPRLEEA